MTSRLIEKCFEQEIIEERIGNTKVFLYDPKKITQEEMEELIKAKPGEIIRIKDPIGYKMLTTFHYRS